jgi:protein TonB
MTAAGGIHRKFIVSLLLHGAALCCVASMWFTQDHPAIPMFQAGEFSLDTIPADAAPATIVIEPTPPAMEEVKEEAEEPDDVDLEETEEEPDSEIQPSEVPPPPAAPAQATPPPPAPVDSTTRPSSLSAEGASSQGVTDAARLQSYIRPIYPPGARARGEEGSVTVRAVVTSAGKAQTAEVVRSSGYPALDQAAMNAVRRARFIPARKGRMPIESETSLMFRFNLVD